MKQKSGFTFVAQAIALVPEFKKLVRKPEQQVTLRGQSQSTLQNYIRRIALLVLRFEKLPEQIDPRKLTSTLQPWLVIPNRPREAVLNTWCTVCALSKIACLLFIPNKPFHT